MFYDASGNPDPSGRFKFINGKLVMRDGAIMFFDHAARADAAIALTDAERDYAVSRARADHSTRYGHLPADRRPAFAATDQARAIAAAETGKRQVADRQRVFAADQANDPSFRQGAIIAQRVLRKRALSSAWKA